jgi:sulfate adenylyltransferase subunit 2
MNTLDLLEAEAIYVLREVHAQFEHPALLFSGGKDSIVVTHLAQKAFAPGRIPMPLLHIDTGHNFPETLAFRDAHVARLGTRLIVGSVEQSIQAGRVFEEQALDANRNRLQSHTLMETVRENRFDALVGGARRDEEKSRAKERFFSHRNIHGQWDPKNQRPELWSIFNGYHFAGEHFRVCPSQPLFRAPPRMRGTKRRTPRHKRVLITPARRERAHRGKARPVPDTR